MEVLHGRCAGLDVHKDTVVACVRIQQNAAAPVHQVQTFGTTTQELLALHPDDFKKEELKLALGQHARSTRYLEAVASGAPRHDLNAQPVEPVAPEHVHHAILEVYRRRLSRDKVAATQWLRARLVAAIEASGLARDAYLERMPTPDPVAAAVLDEAFAELAERAAKREALRRAFAASGKTAEEFADMYGMDLAVVKQAVAT